jgi:hypothetical protein
MATAINRQYGANRQSLEHDGPSGDADSAPNSTVDHPERHDSSDEFSGADEVSWGDERLLIP